MTHSFSSSKCPRTVREWPFWNLPTFHLHMPELKLNTVHHQSVCQRMQLVLFLISNNYQLRVFDVLHSSAPSHILTKHEFRISLLNQHIYLHKQSQKKDQVPGWVWHWGAAITSKKKPTKKTPSDADTWLPVTHLPCHHGLRKKCLTLCLKKLRQAILKCTADL